MSASSSVGARLVYVCPSCRGAFASSEADAHCTRCELTFGDVAGIPDLRLEYADPYSTRASDDEAATALAARFDELDLAGLLQEHWRMTGKREELAERFVARDLEALDRAEAYVQAVEGALGRSLGPGDRVLEIGCGTAALAAVAARRGCAVVASDVSMRWLVLARKQLEEAQVEVELLCCAAEALPVEASSFDVVLAGDVVEHVADQELFARECARVLGPGGMLFLATPNRYSLGLEPHVRLWGVGFLPRPVARRYVERVRKTGYDHVRLLSSFALRRLLGRAGFRVTIAPPEVPEASQHLASGLELRLVRVYNRVRGLRLARLGLFVVGPFFHVFAVRRET